MLVLLRASATYFALAFAAGFGLGLIRVPFLVPRCGERAAELLELPVLVVLCALLARWRVTCTSARSPAWQLAVGWLALAMLLATEVLLGVLVLGKSLRAVLWERDAVAGPAYCAALAAFACWPWWWAHRARRAERSRRAPWHPPPASA
jgi:hypothetical protein